MAAAAKVAAAANVNMKTESIFDETKANLDLKNVVT